MVHGGRGTEVTKPQSWADRIHAKHIDFLLCDSGTMEAELAVELDQLFPEQIASHAIGLSTGACNTTTSAAYRAVKEGYKQGSNCASRSMSCRSRLPVTCH